MWITIANKIIIDPNTANQRLDRFLRKYFRPYPDISLVMIFKAIRTGQIKVNDKKVSEGHKLLVWDQIIFHHSFIELLNNKNPIEKKKKPTSWLQKNDISLDIFQS